MSTYSVVQLTKSYLRNRLKKFEKFRRRMQFPYHVYYVVRRIRRFLAARFFARNTATKFIILGSARTGTNYLQTLLSSHKSIRVFGEIFMVSSLRRNPSALIRPAHFLESDVFNKYPKRISAVGFKLMYTHARYGLDGIYNSGLAIFTSYERKRLESVWRYLEKHREIKIIHLQRRNIVRTAVSLLRARQTNQWALRHSEKPSQTSGRIELSREFLEAFHRDLGSKRAACEASFAGHAVFEVYYEDLVTDRNRELDRIMDFLGVERQHLSTPLVKQNTRSMRDAIADFEHLRNSVEGTRFEHMLSDFEPRLRRRQ